MKCLLTLLFVHLLSTAVYSQLECPASNNATVLILGGGMAGVAAANCLSELGINNFVILEAQDRLGGRMRIEEIAPGVNVNVGANWIHGVDRQAPRRHPLFNLAVECGIEGSYSNFDDITFYDENGNGVNENALRFVDFATVAVQSEQAASQLEEDVSARTVFTDLGWTPANANDRFVEWFSFDFSTTEPPDVTSIEAYVSPGTDTDFLNNPLNTPMDWLVTDNRGTAYLVECLANSFSNNPSTDERIHLNTLVTRVEYGDNCVCATVMEDGEQRRYCGDYAIVTFSIGVLKNQASTLFSPPLPTAKTEALSLLNNGFYYIIFARFSNRFWDDNYQFIGHVSSERGYLPVISVIPESHGINATALPVTGDVAFRLAGMTDEELRAEVGTLFRNIYGNVATDPINIVSMRWGLNDLFMGSYSNVRPGGNGGFAELARPEGNMYLAGEGTSSRYHGYMHGAYFTGIDAANAINDRRSAGVNVTGNALLLFTIAVCNILYMFF